MKCYVYTYTLNGVPIYVGMGTHNTKRAYGRALDFRGHAEIASTEYEGISVTIVGDDLSETEARSLETFLIHTLSQYHVLRNVIRSADIPEPQLIQGKVGRTNAKQLLRSLLATQREHTIRECLAHMNAVDPAMGHRAIFLEPTCDVAATMLGALMPKYDAALDSLIEQFQSWWRENEFNPALDRVVVVVPTQDHAKKFAKAVYRSLTCTFIRRPVRVCSMERWLKMVRLDPKQNRALRAAVR